MTAPGLDPAAILAALGIHDAVAISANTTGWGDSAIWRVERPAGSFALRLFPPGWDRVAERELLAQQLAGAAGVPVPALVAAGVWQERPVQLQGWLPGRTLFDALAARPWLAWPLGLDFGRAQARLHRLTAPARLDELRPRDDQFAQAAPGDDALATRLAAMPPRRRLLHLDYHPLNVLVRGRQVSGVIDWSNARAGDPRADVARTLSILRVAPQLLGRGQRPAERLALRRLTAGYLAGYRRSGGRLDELDLFLAWAGGVLLRDLAPKLERADAPLARDQLAAVSRQVGRWRRAAGLPPLPACRA